VGSVPCSARADEFKIFHVPDVEVSAQVAETRDQHDALVGAESDLVAVQFGQLEHGLPVLTLHHRETGH